MLHIFPIIIGFVLDLIFGDPYFLCKIISHPVILIGKLIIFLENLLRKFFKENKFSLRIAGFLLVVTVLLITFIISEFILNVCYNISIYFGFFMETFLCYQIFATKSLKTESMKVYYSLQNNDLEQSRKYLSFIVGRDTENLDEKDVIKATVETISENTTDGVIAPMIYMFLFGAVGGLTYKAINTIDSMIGYQNEKYKFFGTFGAKLDDLANYIPARITSLIMIVATLFLKYNCKNAIKIFIRDRYNHKSPNSAQTESVVAGALNIQLAGNAYYFGKLYEKDKIGDKTKEIENNDIIKTNKILYLTSILSIFILAVITLIIWRC